MNIQEEYQIGPDDVIIWFEYERDFIKLHFADGKILKLSADDIGREMLETIKSKVQYSRSFISFLRTSKSISAVIDRCWLRS